MPAVWWSPRVHPRMQGDQGCCVHSSLELFIEEDRHARAPLGNEFSLIIGGSQRTAADESSSSDELSGQLRTPTDEGERATFGPWREVKVTLPSAVVGALENAATVLGVSLETLVAQIITRPDGGAADEDLGRGE